MKVPTFVSGKPARGERREHVGSAKRAKALPAVFPLHLAADQGPEMTGGEVNVNDSDGRRRERVHHKAGQRKHEPESHLYLNSSTVANGSTDHGRRRLSVNFVFCPGFTSTIT